MINSKRNNYLLKKYGITEEQYEVLLQKQGNCCALCKKPVRSFKKRLAVEHDHFTKEIRGLVCVYCNRRIIGRYRSPTGQEILKRLIKYLDGPYTGYIIPNNKRKKKRNG